MPGLSLFQHVDDLAERHVANSSRRLGLDAVRSGIEVAAALRRRRIKISSRTTVVASKRSLAKSIATQLGKCIGVKLQVALAAEDLGIETGAGARRAARGQTKRRGKALKRAKRVGAMARRTPQAAAMYATGVTP